MPTRIFVGLIAVCLAPLAFADDSENKDEFSTIVVVDFRTRASFASDAEYGKYVQDTIRVGYRVRATADYGSVKRGMLGTYYGTGLTPPCSVVWDPDLKSGSVRLPNVPLNKATHVYWVFWHQVEIIDSAP